MWIDANDIKLLNTIFEPEDLIPRNQKNNFKLRHISFFNTNMKAITNVCKTLEKVSMHELVAHQYTEVLRKMGLINKKVELTKYGLMLLQILHYDNNRIINVINKATSLDDIPEEIPFIIEFFLYCVVQKCLRNKLECDEAGIDYSDLASEPINNLKYFFSNVIDTLNEPTNSNSNVNSLFEFDNNDFYYTLQGINFSGYEIKRLLRLPFNEIEKAWKAYLDVLNSYKKQNRASLSTDEQKYYDYAKYYDALVQKDVRNRVKQSIFNFILLESIQSRRKKIKIVKNIDYERILSYDFIEQKYEDYGLRDIYNLVFYENDSKYIEKIIKPFKIDDSLVTHIIKVNEFSILESNLQDQNINLWDEIIFVDELFTKIHLPNVYMINDIRKNVKNVNIKVEIKELINTDRTQEILEKLKGV